MRESMPLALKMEERATSQGMQVASTSRKKKRKRILPSSLWRKYNIAAILIMVQ